LYFFPGLAPVGVGGQGRGKGGCGGGGCRQPWAMAKNPRERERDRDSERLSTTLNNRLSELSNKPASARINGTHTHTQMVGVRARGAAAAEGDSCNLFNPAQAQSVR